MEAIAAPVANTFSHNTEGVVTSIFTDKIRKSSLEPAQTNPSIRQPDT
jgi:hypothetical protein